MKSFKAPALHPQRCYILDSVVTLSVRFILTILLGQAEQCWTLFDPTSHPEAFRKTSHGFQQLIPSFSFPGTKMYSSLPIHTNIHALIELLAQAESFCRRCLLSFSKCQTAHRLFRNRFFLSPLRVPIFSYDKLLLLETVMDGALIQIRTGMTLPSLQQVAQYLKIYSCPPLFGHRSVLFPGPSQFISCKMCPILIFVQQKWERGES